MWYVPELRRPSRPNAESLSGHQGEHGFAKEGFKSRMTNYFQYPHTSPTPPRRTCRLLKKLLRCIILIQSLLQLKWNYQVDPDTKTRGISIQKLSLALSRHPDEGTRCEIMIYIKYNNLLCSDYNSLFNLCIFILQYEFCKYNSSVLQACLLSLNIKYLGVLWSSHHTM